MREGIHWGMLKNDPSTGSKSGLSMSTCKASLSRPGSICDFILCRSGTLDGSMAFGWFHGDFVVYPNIFAARRVYRVKNGVGDENRDLGTP